MSRNRTDPNDAQHGDRSLSAHGTRPNSRTKLHTAPDQMTQACAVRYRVPARSGLFGLSVTCHRFCALPKAASCRRHSKARPPACAVRSGLASVGHRTVTFCAEGDCSFCLVSFGTCRMVFDTTPACKTLAVPLAYPRHPGPGSLSPASVRGGDQVVRSLLRA
jgi:hypothetical protein